MTGRARPASDPVDTRSSGRPRLASLARGLASLARGLASLARRLADRSFGRLDVPAREWAAVVPIMLLAAADRFVNLPARGIWDSDQGYELGAIWDAVQARQLPALGSPAFTLGPTFHHGALFYDLMMPVSWASHGNPTAVVAEIAVFGFAAVPLVWWVARSIGGTSAGLAAALLAAVSPSLIENSTFIWNPVLVEPGVALACLGAWQAWKMRNPRWWVVAAAGTAIASQSHLTGLALVFPMAILFLLTMWRSPAADRRRLLAWGLAGVALFVLTWLPWIAYELTHEFAETRAILAFRQEGPPGADPFSRLFISTVRIVAWPLTHWPMDGVAPGFPIALAVWAGLTAGLVWRIVGTLAPPRAGAGEAPSRAGSREGRPEPDRIARHEREGLLFVGGSLLLIAAILALSLKEVSQFSDKLNQEQYHSVADVFVLLAAGLLVGGLWRARPLRGRIWSGPAIGSLVLAGLVAVGVSHWPPLTARDGGWPAAQAATARLEGDIAERELAIAALPSFIPADHYGYPLRLDGYRLVAPAGASTIVLVCYPEWSKKPCAGEAESEWIAANLPGVTLTLIDRWEPAPQRVLSVYRVAQKQATGGPGEATGAPKEAAVAPKQASACPGEALECGGMECVSGGTA
jgi:4-amino-4-deoxy-L-arabinose transferase-like glycosyltransferase